MPQAFTELMPKGIGKVCSGQCKDDDELMTQEMLAGPHGRCWVQVESVLKSRLCGL